MYDPSIWRTIHTRNAQGTLYTRQAEKTALQAKLTSAWFRRLLGEIMFCYTGEWKKFRRGSELFVIAFRNTLTSRKVTSRLLAVTPIWRWALRLVVAFAAMACAQCVFIYQFTTLWVRGRASPASIGAAPSTIRFQYSQLLSHAPLAQSRGQRIICTKLFYMDAALDSTMLI